MKKIAIFGGAFNPIRLGHLHAAKFVLESLPEINEVWISPTYVHSFNKEMEDPKHRVKMCKLAINDSRIKIFDYEIHHKLDHGTLDFYKILRKDPKFKDLDFYWVIGMDNANCIEKWVNWEILIKALKFIVISRENFNMDRNNQWYKKSPHIFLQKENKIEAPSTKIRELLSIYYETSNSEVLMELRKYLSPLVLKYILKNKLYDTNKTSI